MPSQEFRPRLTASNKNDSNMPRLVRKVWSFLRHFLGMDRAIAFTVLARIWSSCAGVITVILIAKALSPTEQGYYYTFGSLVALQIVFELGFSFVILQMAGHEMPLLSIADDGTISGDAVAHARLASVLQKSVRWYSVAAVLMSVCLVPGGLHFFAAHQRADAAVHYRLPWVLVVVAACMTFQLDPVLSFLEGCGFVAKVAHLRLRQALAGSLLGWLALATRHGLFAPAAMIGGQAVMAILWLYRRRLLLAGLLRYDPGAQRIHWREEVWPFQWRIAISWISGYFIFQLFAPVLFALRGPTAAGQMGMSLSVVTVLSSVCLSWVATKAAPFGTLIARRDFVQLDRIFFRSLLQSTSLFAAGACSVWLTILILQLMHNRFALRMLQPYSFGMLLAAALLNHVWSSEAVYLRAHKQEKYLGLSVGTAVSVSLSTYLLGKTYGPPGIVTGYFLVCLILGLGAGSGIFIHYRRLWHRV